MEIVLKNIDSLIKMKSDRFNKDYQDTFLAIDYNIEFQFPIFYVSTKLEAEEGDFGALRNYFKRILQGTLKSAMFYPLGEQFRLYFEVIEFKNINVKGKIFDLTYRGKFNFEFTFPISELPRLIQEIDDVIKS